jgi:hypothetical protein
MHDTVHIAAAEVRLLSGDEHPAVLSGARSRGVVNRKVTVMQ